MNLMGMTLSMVLAVLVPSFTSGYLQVLVKPRAGGLGSSDFGLGTELLDGIDDEELERKLTVERNNGRLAMVAIMGLMVQVWFWGEKNTPI